MEKTCLLCVLPSIQLKGQGAFVHLLQDPRNSRKPEEGTMGPFGSSLRDPGVLSIMPDKQGRLLIALGAITKPSGKDSSEAAGTLDS